MMKAMMPPTQCAKCALLPLAVLVLCQQPAPAGPPDLGRGTVQYLLARIRPFRSDGVYYEVGGDDVKLAEPHKEAAYIPSFEVPKKSPLYPVLTQYGRAWTYDLAVETIALVLAGKHAEAKRLLLTLQSVQLPDGALGFSFNVPGAGDNFYNYSLVRAGALSWAGYAAVLYEREAADHTFRPFAGRIVGWLLKHQIEGDPIDDPRVGMITGGYGQWAPDYSSLTKVPCEWTSVEHQIDAYFLLREFGRTDPDQKAGAQYTQAADRIKTSLLRRLWAEPAPGLGRFYQGVDEQNLNMGRALDCCGGWGALFLLAVGEREKAEAALRYTERTFATTFTPAAAPNVGPVRLYRPYAGKTEGIDWDRRYPDVVWTEGSLGVALSYLRTGRKDRFDGIVAEVLKLCTTPGDASSGVRYTRYSQDLRGHGGDIDQDDFIRDLTRAPSAMSTAWLLLVLESAKEANATKFWGPDQ